jgi:predicted MFS family arabinose efflux permease
VADPSIAPILTPAFLGVCAVTFLGFAAQSVIQPVLPILVIERGGGATVVGLVVAAFSVPSVLLRPFLGRLVDQWSSHRTFSLGAAGIGLSGALYLIPSLPAIVLVRILHGSAWAAFNSAGYSMAARFAPPARRGEAIVIFNLMPGIAQTLAPGAGLLLLGITGTAGPFLAVLVLGFAALLVAALAVPRRQPPPSLQQTGFLQSLYERGALLPMTLELLFTSVNSLFLVYPPVFALHHGIPITDLLPYYVVYGAVLIVARFVSRRYVDRFSRHAAMVAGGLLAIAALAVAVPASTVAMLTGAGALYALAASWSTPSFMTFAIDRSDPLRVGAAMATYTLGLQLGLGAGAAIWGWTIDHAGFGATYLGAIAVQAVLVAVVIASWLRKRSISPPLSG